MRKQEILYCHFVSFSVKSLMTIVFVVNLYLNHLHPIKIYKKIQSNLINIISAEKILNNTISALFNDTKCGEYSKIYILTLSFFPKPPTTFLTCFCRGERQKFAGKKSRLNRGLNSQPPGHESDTLTTEPSGWGLYEINPPILFTTYKQAGQ